MRYITTPHALTMLHLARLCGLLIAATAISALADAPVKRPDPARWSKAMAAFAKADEAATPKKGGIVFVGSSSIRMWDTKKSFPDLEIINRGFGGSWIQDSIHFADQVILPYEPKLVVIYAGDNDVSGGLKADAVVEDYSKLVSLIQKKLPETKTIFIAIKPSIKRWNLWPEMKKANDLIASRCQKLPNEMFADIASTLLGKDGKPSDAYFLKDGLHLSEHGYKGWNKLLGGLIEKALATNS